MSQSLISEEDLHGWADDRLDPQRRGERRDPGADLDLLRPVARGAGDDGSGIQRRETEGRPA